MPKRIVLPPPVLKVLAVVGAILVFALVVYSMAGLPAPSESDRVSVFDGSFSIIPPRTKGFQTRVIYGPIDPTYTTQIEVLQAGMVGGADNKLVVSRYRDSLDRAKALELGFTPITFQGKEALMTSMERKHEFIWQIIFERDGQWYQIALRLQRKEDVMNSGWWPFINSFRSKPVAAATTLPATTLPATAPASIQSI